MYTYKYIFIYIHIYIYIYIRPLKTGPALPSRDQWSRASIPLEERRMWGYTSQWKDTPEVTAN